MTNLDVTNLPALHLKGLKMVFQTKDGPFEALKGVDLMVKQGEVTGFLGPNGAGKTTALHILLGFQMATSGTAEIFGEDVKDSPARQRIGYLPEHPQLYGFLTARELLKAAGRLFDLPKDLLRERIESLLEQVGLLDAGNRRIATYSRGMLQRIGLAQALINDPDLVILDEPTSGLDPLGRMDVRKLIEHLREQGKTVFFSSHELSEVERVCDHVVIMARGTIVAEGAADELVAPGESLEQFFVRSIRKEVGAS